jgi:alpha-tubulin suppressor-like RCC1 family protein/lysophospholipase L1-like esterase
MTRLQREWSGPETPVHRRRPARQHALWILIAWLLTCIALTTPSYGQVATLTPLRVVVLGDSYSAGNGAGHYYGVHGCFRSHEAWAEKYVDWLRTQGYAALLTNRACSGSTSEDVYRERIWDDPVSYFLEPIPGPWTATDPRLVDELTSRYYCADTDEETFAFTILRAQYVSITDSTLVDFTCVRHLEAQMLGVGKDTDLVLLTMGGNDLQFGQIVKKCYWGGTFGQRDEATCRGLVDGAQLDVDSGTLTTKIRAALRALRERMRPDARIALNAYPYVDSDSPAHAYTLGTYPVTTKLRQLGATGDAAQQLAVTQDNGDAGRAQTVFVPGIKTCFAGHEPYGGWDDVNPDRWIWEFERGPYGPAFAGDQNDIYHPTPTGHTEWANCLKSYGSFGTSGTLGGDVDVVFVIDATGSMSDDIAAVRAVASDLVDLVDESTSSYRFAVVTYRDWPEYTGDPTDYPSSLELDFTDDKSSIVSAINAIEVDGGGDTPESVYSGILKGLSLDWRTGVQKVIVQMGDAPPHDPEPVLGFTADTVVQTAQAVDPAQVYVVNVSSGSPSAQLVDISTRTGGNVFSAPTPSEVAEAMFDALNVALTKPFAWAGGPYVEAIGAPVVLDASGSFDPDGSIVSYEWDVDGDGDYDTSTSQPSYTYTYTASLSGTVAVRVTDDDGKTAVGTASIDVSSDGDGVPPAPDNCPDVSNHGQSDFDQDGVGDVCDAAPFGGASGTARAVIAAGHSHTLAVMTDGTVKAWGLGSSGQLGRGNKLSSTTPVTVSGLASVASVSGGEAFSLALKTDGTVWAWGANGDGQLGDGTKTGRLSPTQVTGLPTVTAIAAGANHSLAVAADGTVWAWGDNSFGQIGNGNTTDQSRPFHVANVSGVVAIAGGGFHTLVLKGDGTVVGWGDNANGQLGNGTRVTNQLTPVQAQGLNAVTRIAAGFQHSVAVTSTGTAWSWGNNPSGQLCDGSTTDRLAPAQIASAVSARSVAAGLSHTVILKTDGTAQACGNNAQGQLGDGTTTGRRSPVSVVGLTGASAVAANWQHSLAVRSDGTDRAWGYNKYGQLGDGTNTDRRAPVSVLSITGNAQP